QSAADGAVVVYAKAWGGRAQYDDPAREQAQREANRNWRITEDVMRNTADGKFMHCLPVRRNVIVDDAVIDGPSAIHLLQAEMRLHGQKALLEKMWGV
ncbi:MAG: acetylornithine carbamoyltransferase, partial [Calditrichaeota bacterium]|nr:acetylornithine carbamoyltransferase [Calditrichota bacterium]